MATASISLPLERPESPIPVQKSETVVLETPKETEELWEDPGVRQKQRMTATIEAMIERQKARREEINEIGYCMENSDFSAMTSGYLLAAPHE